MTEFLVELYVPKAYFAGAAAGCGRLRAAADELTAEGWPVRLVRSIFVPEDETCFLLIEALTADEVRETARRAGVTCERVTETAADPTHNGRY